MGAATTFYSILRARGQKKVCSIENNKKNSGVLKAGNF
jgi:hypothetical protein